MTMGKSISPDTMTARVPALLFFAASLRWTMSWSVPCVAIVMNVAPQKRCPYRIFLSQNVGTLFQEAESFFRSPGKEFPVIPSVHDGGNGVPAAGNVGEQYPKGGEHGDAEYRRLQHVRPDDGFQTAYGRINGGGHADDDQRGDVKQDYLFGICRSIGDKLISNDKQNACKVEPGSAGQNPADQENHGGSAPGQQSEPFFQIFINGDYL